MPSRLTSPHWGTARAASVTVHGYPNPTAYAETVKLSHLKTAAQPLVHELEVFLPLTDQLPAPLRPAVRANLELHDTPELRCCNDR